jgi:hypothetical protein
MRLPFPFPVDLVREAMSINWLSWGAGRRFKGRTETLSQFEGLDHPKGLGGALRAPEGVFGLVGCVKIKSRPGNANIL